MKINTILSLVLVTLATKVSAECFASKFGSPCCTKTKEVVFNDKNGKWGIENGVKCGIEEIKNPVSNVEWVKRSTDLNDDKTNTKTTKTKITKVKTTKIKTVKTKIVTKSKKITSTKKVKKTKKVTKVTTKTKNSSKNNWTNYMDKVKNLITAFPADAINKIENVKYPTVEKVTYYSKTTESDRPLNVILPPDYDKTKKYPVLYYLHGIMTDQDVMLGEEIGTIAIPGNLISQHKAKEMIIVLPYQYAPAPGTEVEPGFNQEYFDGYDNFINDLINDIMPYMEKHYPIATGRENTGICGFSMGGRNSLYIGYTRSDLFGWVGSFSPCPGVTPGEDMLVKHKGLLKEDELRANNPPILTMLSSGTKDVVVGDFPESYHNILTKNNQKHIWYQIPDADHDATAVTVGYYNFISSIFGSLNN
eukprot:jgi/Orpsp1_1/1177116/evm.model.c7180000060250.1